jgi:hypothetical protein
MDCTCDRKLHTGWLPGVYVIANSTRQPLGISIIDKRVVYIGETVKAGEGILEASRCAQGAITKNGYGFRSGAFRWGMGSTIPLPNPFGLRKSGTSKERCSTNMSIRFMPIRPEIPSRTGSHGPIQRIMHPTTNQLLESVRCQISRRAPAPGGNGGSQLQIRVFSPEASHGRGGSRG